MLTLPKIVAKKSLGQNFLQDPNVIRKIVESLRLDSSDWVLEIGCGTGALTAHLAGKVQQLVGVELDTALFERLRGSFGGTRFLNRDVLTLELSRLREEFQLAGRAGAFDELKVFITGDRPDLSYAEAAARLGTSEAAAKMTVTRMRQRYRALLRAEIANTVEDPAEVDAELRELAAVLRG